MFIYFKSARCDLFKYLHKKTLTCRYGTFVCKTTHKILAGLLSNMIRKYVKTFILKRIKTKLNEVMPLEGVGSIDESRRSFYKLKW